MYLFQKKKKKKKSKKQKKITKIEQKEVLTSKKSIK